MMSHALAGSRCQRMMCTLDATPAEASWTCCGEASAQRPPQQQKQAERAAAAVAIHRAKGQPGATMVGIFSPLAAGMPLPAACSEARPSLQCGTVQSRGAMATGWFGRVRGGAAIFLVHAV